MVVYLSKEDIIYINQRTILTHGGNYLPPSNFLHESYLDFLIEAVYSEMFGKELYPNISDKASVYCFNIICNHIFTDGNKRTGLETALAFLKLNNFRINPNLPHNDLLNFIIKIASGQSTLDECRAWFQENIVKLQ
jgi:death on curing protein